LAGGAWTGAVRIVGATCREWRGGRASQPGPYALALRINDEFQFFGQEGIERPQRSKKTRCIGADILIAESTWKSKCGNELSDYLATTVRAALVACLSRLRKDKEQIDEQSLPNQVDSALEDFRQFDYSTQFPPSTYCPSCGQLLKTGLTKQCLKCGVDYLLLPPKDQLDALLATKLHCITSCSSRCSSLDKAENPVPLPMAEQLTG
jgi:hypothetical protein